MENNIAKITIVKAKKLHTRFLWECRNEETSRKMFENTNYVRWENHEQWMERSLMNKNRYLYIGLTEKHIPFGLVRLDKESNGKNRYTISINLAKKWRQKKLAKTLLTKATRKISTELKDTIVIIAKIKNQNIASKGLFSSAGYKEVQRIEDQYTIYETDIEYVRED